MNDIHITASRSPDPTSSKQCLRSGTGRGWPALRSRKIYMTMTMNGKDIHKVIVV